MAETDKELDPRAFSAGLVALGKLLAAIQAPGGVAVTAENVAAQVDPALAPEIIAAQVLIPLLADVLVILGTQPGVPGPRWLGAPRAI